MQKSLQTNRSERGAALVTVILISVLLLTASIAMLTAVGANSRNSTDVLSETKAYYAAESGIQAVVNVLRNRVEGDGTPVDYSEATNDPDLSTWLPYNYPTSGTANRVVIGQTAASYVPNDGAAYSIAVVDPDNSANSSTFNTVGGFAGDPTAVPTPTPGVYMATRVYRNATNPTVNYTVLSFVPQPSTTVTHPDGPGNFPGIGSFRFECFGTCGPITETRFEIDLNLTAPRSATAPLIGTIAIVGGETKIRFDTQGYKLLGGSIKLCDSPGDCTTIINKPVLPPTGTGGVVIVPVGYANLDPILPYRLKITSTGYGPNGAVKKLEAIIQKNLVNNYTNVAATTMLGSTCVPTGTGQNATHCFEPGTSNNVSYSGGNCAIGCVPSFGFTSSSNYQTAMGSPLLTASPPRMTPPPALLSNQVVPPWQQSPANMDVIIDLFRREAQHGQGGRYLNPGPNNVVNPGDYATGTGVTFCEGSCNVSGDGGGTLVVTGKLTNLGGFNFKGMIIVIGEEGWERTGGGGGSITGNVVIAPYNLKVYGSNIRPYVPQSPIPAAFLPPRYWINGGGASDIIYQDVSSTFDSISSISDFVVGVAEK